MLALFFGSLIVSNIIFAKFLGTCPYLGVSKKTSTAFGMGVAVTFVMLLASTVTFLINHLLIMFGIQYLITIVFILIIASLVQLVETIMKKTSPALYKALGVYLPLITTNCAILGVALINIKENYNFIQMLIFSLGTALGFILAIVLFASIRERIEYSNIPNAFKGTPIALIIAGLLSMAFMGFNGLS